MHMPKSAKPQSGWVYSPPKEAPPPVRPLSSAQVEEKANALVATVLKPRFVPPPPEDPQFNYIEDIYTKWYRSYFYFCAQYRSAGPYALGGTFEAKFARLKYAGDGRFDLAFQRHTGEWFDVYAGLTLDECLGSIQSDAWFHP